MARVGNLSRLLGSYLIAKQSWELAYSLERRDIDAEVKSLRTISLNKMDGVEAQRHILHSGMAELNSLGYLASTEHIQSNHTLQKQITRALIPFASQMVEYDDSLFATKCSIISDIKKKRVQMRQELDKLSRPDLSNLPDIVKIDSEFLRANKATRDAVTKSYLSGPKTHGNAIHRGLFNFDQGCTLNAVTQALLSLRGLPQTEHPIAQALNFLATSDRRFEDASDLRAAVGPEFALVEAGKITWFPARIFLRAAVLRFPALRNAATCRTSVGGTEATPETMHRLIATGNQDLAQMVSANSLVFHSLPQILIFDLVQEFAVAKSYEVAIPRQVELTAADGSKRMYSLRAVVVEHGRFHTSALIRDRNGLLTHISDLQVHPWSDCDLRSASVLIYEA
jgi:hypothetical protein